MTTVMRTRVEKELDRLYDVIEKLEPESNEYRAVTDRIQTLTVLINQDDERIDAATASENKNKNEQKSIKNTFKIGLFGVGVTALSWVGTWIFNERAQDKAHDFESDYAYTSKARQWLTKEPSRR